MVDFSPLLKECLSGQVVGNASTAGQEPFPAVPAESQADQAANGRGCVSVIFVDQWVNRKVDKSLCPTLCLYRGDKNASAIPRHGHGSDNSPLL